MATSINHVADRDGLWAEYQKVMQAGNSSQSFRTRDGFDNWLDEAIVQYPAMFLRFSFMDSPGHCYKVEFKVTRQEVDRANLSRILANPAHNYKFRNAYIRYHTDNRRILPGPHEMATLKLLRQVSPSKASKVALQLLQSNSNMEDVLREYMRNIAAQMANSIDRSMWKPQLAKPEVTVNRRDDLDAYRVKVTFDVSAESLTKSKNKKKFIEDIIQQAMSHSEEIIGQMVMARLQKPGPRKTITGGINGPLARGYFLGQISALHSKFPFASTTEVMNSCLANPHAVIAEEMKKSHDKWAAVAQHPYRSGFRFTKPRSGATPNVK